MSPLPLVSVALCTYNGARFLREQLDSLLAQDYAPLEIVVADDGSTDETLAILDEYSRRDPRIRVHRNPSNLGFRKNFENVMHLCRGDLIAPCDQDDIWHPAKLGILQRAMDGAILAYCDSEFVTSAGEPLGIRASSDMNMYQGSDPRVFAFHNCISGHAMLFERRLFEAALPFPAAGYHDGWLAFVAASIGRIRYVDQPLVKYRRHDQAQSSMGRRHTGHSGASKEASRLKQSGDWFQALQAYERCPERPLFRALHAAWLSRANRYVVPGLFALIFRHRNAFFYVRKGGWLNRALHCGRYLWGLKAKQLFRPGRYRD